LRKKEAAIVWVRLDKIKTRTGIICGQSETSNPHVYYASLQARLVGLATT